MIIVGYPGIGKDIIGSTLILNLILISMDYDLMSIVNSLVSSFNKRIKVKNKSKE